MREASVSVRGLSVSVGSSEVLSNISFELRRGLIAMIAGPSGSGKSTLLKVIAGLIPGIYSSYRVSGEVLVYGMRPHEALKARLVSYVPQDPWGFFMGTRVCDELGLSGVPIGEFARVCDRSLSTLSDGELFRLLTYVAYRSGARLVLIDEPSSHLDSQTLTELMEELKRLCSEHGLTAVLADHNVGLLTNYVDELVALGSYSDAYPAVRPVGRGSPGDYTLLAMGLAFSYDGRTVFEGLDIALREGEVMCVFGRNGSGKTTLLKVLAGVLKPHRGYLYVRKPLFYVPQRPIYWFASKSVYDELMLYLRLSRKRLDLNVLQEMFKLTGLFQRNPYTLSVGEARRLSLALAYVSSAKLVLLDEPTIGLDVPSTSLLVSLLNELSSEGRSVVITSHTPKLGDLCDHTVRLPLR